MNKSKILLITDIFPPQIGGPATFISALAENLSIYCGHEVTVICTSDRVPAEADNDRGYTVRRLYKSNTYRYKAYVRYVLSHEIYRHKTILVNGLESMVYNIASTINRPYIIKVVGDYVWELARNTGNTQLDFDAFQVDKNNIEHFKRTFDQRNKSLSFAQCIVTPSDYMHSVVKGWGLPEEKIFTIHNGSDLRRFSDFRSLRRTSDDLHLLFVGRLTNWKGVETLLLALKNLNNVRATIIGDGPELLSLLNLAEQLQFKGRCSQDIVHKYMGQTHALVLTSLYEGLSHTLLEAMAAGLPCIASNIGGNAEIISPGIDGLLVPPQNVEELTAGIAFLQNNEDMRLAMSRQAKMRSEMFSIDSTVQKYVELLVK
jgi:glycosyltransferase involved in cell wall biosynthesis